MRIVVIEDEPRAANRLAKLITEVEPKAEIVARIESVKQGLSFFAENQNIDLVFSDIQLTDDLSFEIFAKIQPQFPVIFTTAYDSYAIDAFKANGIDYLLKPLDKNAIAKALEKYKTLTKSSTQVDLGAIAHLLSAKSITESAEYKNRFMVKVGQHIKSVNAEDIFAFYSKDKLNFLMTREKRSYPIDHTLDAVMDLLNPNEFFKISRSCIVSLKGVTDITAYSNSRLRVQITGLEDEVIVVAREKTKAFKVWLGE